MSRATLLLAAALFSATASGVVAEPESAADFWREREASYRASLRGPFTAVRADYLARGEELVLFAGANGLGTAPSPGAGVRIVLEERGFLVAPLDESDVGPPTVGGEPLREVQSLGEGAYDDPDVRVGPYLLSFDLQSDELGRVLAYDPDRLEGFHGFAVFDPDDGFRVEARVGRADRDTVSLGTTRGLEKLYMRAAVLEFEIAGRECRLTGFRAPGDEAGPLFVPYLDRTSGTESYAVGRYLRVEAEEGRDTAVVDFNRSTNPWCAYSPFYNCPMPPRENHLSVAIRAGEKTPAGH